MQRNGGTSRLCLAGIFGIIFIAVLANYVFYNDDHLSKAQRDGIVSRKEKEECDKSLKNLRSRVETLEAEKKVLLSEEEKCHKEKAFLGIKFNEALKDKISALEDKMKIILQSKQTEEDVLSLLTRIDSLEEEVLGKQMIIDDKDEKLELVKNEIHSLRKEILEC